MNISVNYIAFFIIIAGIVLDILQNYELLKNNKLAIMAGLTYVGHVLFFGLLLFVPQHYLGQVLVALLFSYPAFYYFKYRYKKNRQKSITMLIFVVVLAVWLFIYDKMYSFTTLFHIFFFIP